jgi:ABC-type uncharacterized transport system substrate-binding protein
MPTTLIGARRNMSILKGEKSGDLPIQEPTKCDLIINLKARKGARTHRP